MFMTCYCMSENSSAIFFLKSGTFPECKKIAYVNTEFVVAIFLIE